MPGGMAGFEFFVAHFSAPLVCGEQRVVAADPADGCGTLVNAAQVAGAAVLVSRGTCSFESKSAWAAAAGKASFRSFPHTLRAPGVPGGPVARTNRQRQPPAYLGHNTSCLASQCSGGPHEVLCVCPPASQCLAPSACAPSPPPYPHRLTPSDCSTAPPHPITPPPSPPSPFTPPPHPITASNLRTPSPHLISSPPPPHLPLCCAPPPRAPSPHRGEDIDHREQRPW